MPDIYNHLFFTGETPAEVESYNDDNTCLRVAFGSDLGQAVQFLYFESETIRNQFLHSLRYQIDQILGGQK